MEERDMLYKPKWAVLKEINFRLRHNFKNVIKT